MTSTSDRPELQPSPEVDRAGRWTVLTRRTPYLLETLAMRRPSLRFGCTLIATVVTAITFFSTAEAFGGTSATSSCVCQLLISGSASDDTAIEQAAVSCVARGQDCASAVQLAVAPALLPFADSFTGTVVCLMSYCRQVGAWDASSTMLQCIIAHLQV